MKRAEGRSATIVGPRGKAGTYQVRWRYAGRVQSLTVARKADANTVQKHVNAAGCDLMPADARRRAFGSEEPRSTANSARIFSDVNEERLKALTNPTTVAQHRTKVRNMPFAGKPVHEVTADEVNAWLSGLKGTYKRGTIRVYGIVARSVLGYAYEHGYRPDNPCKAIKLPAKSRTHKPITPEQYATVIAVTERPEHAALWRLLTFTGLRIGEALALQAGDVDLAGGRLWVLRALDSSHRGIGEGKTAASVDENKPVALDPATVDALRPFVIGKAPADWVFVGHDGGRMQYETTRRHWNLVRKAAGLPAGTRMHDLRHTHATWLINDGVQLSTVGRRLRHTSFSTTADTYSDIDPVGEAAIMASMASRDPANRPTPIKAARSA